MNILTAATEVLMAAFSARNQQATGENFDDLRPAECVTVELRDGWDNRPYSQNAVVSKVLPSGEVLVFYYRGTSQVIGCQPVHHWSGIRRVSKSQITRLGAMWVD